MSFLASIKNPPKEAVYWLPVYYYRNPETGIYTPYSPDDYLGIGESWLCPLSAGAGIMVDYRCVVYNSGYNIIGTRDLKNIVVKDGEEFVYDWGVPEAAPGLIPWVIGGGLAVIGILVAIAKKRR